MQEFCTGCGYDHEATDCLYRLSDEEYLDLLDRNGLGCGAPRRSPVTPCELGDAMRGEFRSTSSVKGPRR